MTFLFDWINYEVPRFEILYSSINRSHGRATAQAVSRRPPTAEARVRSRVPMWDLWWTKWHWDRFLPEYFGFPLSISFQPVFHYLEK